MLLLISVNSRYVILFILTIGLLLPDSVDDALVRKEANKLVYSLLELLTRLGYTLL